MKICVIGAPSTGKSVFAKSLAAELSKAGYSCELVQEYASQYIQQVGTPDEAWEQLVISIGQYMAEQKTTRDYMITDAAMFATYIYAQRVLPSTIAKTHWPRYRNLLDMLRLLARQSIESYDKIFLMTRVFKPARDGVRLADHLDYQICQEINSDLESYLLSERATFTKIDGKDPTDLKKALRRITNPDAVEPLADPASIEHF